MDLDDDQERRSPRPVDRRNQGRGDALSADGICIIGAGPAGLMAAIHAAQAGAAVVLIEANGKPGRKLLLTGGGRCNFAHAGGPEELARAFGKAGRFLRHSLYEFPPQAIRDFFHARGLASRVEPDGCVFPVGNRAADVLDVLIREVRNFGTQSLHGSPVTDVSAGETFTIATGQRRITAARVIVATGGLSWPQTGSTGDGYRFAQSLGHTVVPPKPALVPLITRESWVGELAGVSLPDVKIRAVAGGHRFATCGNMLFTQAGIGGPAVLDLSRLLADELPQDGSGVPVEIDMAAAVSQAEFDQRLQQTTQTRAKKAVVNVLAEFVPRQLSHILCRLAECDGNLPAGQLSAQVRRRIAALVKGLPLRVTGTEPIAKATVTHGGVSRDEIDPHTMESRIRPGLFFAGEIIDLDGPCGGYNLQMCWSTGASAGRSAARSLAT